MSRPIRVEFPGAIYHVMSRSVAGSQTFADDLNRLRFIEMTRELVEIHKLIVFAFILMRNHFHMLCETPMAGLSRLMQKLLERFTKWFNQRHHRQGHLWQARYKAVLVQEGDYFLHCSRYIHLNPVKAHLCEKPEDYLWSSYPHYLGSCGLFNWVDTSRTLECFGHASEYRAFVLQGLQHDLEDPFEEAKGGLIFGSSDFVDQIRPLVRLPRLLEDVPRIRDLSSKEIASIDAIRETVNHTFSSSSECQRMRILAYVLTRFTDLAGREIADITGRSPASVTHIWRDFQTRLSIDPTLAQKIEALAQLLEKKAVSHSSSENIFCGFPKIR
jgi:putative transposase